LISRIWSIVRACDFSSLGLATANARHIAGEIATFNRLREKRNSSYSTASTLGCHRASTATATSSCWRGRLLTGNFRCDRERLELAGLGHRSDATE
jgi:hypothetical protein